MQSPTEAPSSYLTNLCQTDNKNLPVQAPLIKIYCTERTGEKVQHLRALTPLTEGWGSIPSIYLVAHTTVLGDPISSLDLQGHQVCIWYTLIHSGKTSIHIKIKKLKIIFLNQGIWGSYYSDELIHVKQTE